MKITIIQGAFLPVPAKLGGAVEKMWFALSKEFAKAGHEVVYISRLFEDFAEEQLTDNILHLRVKGYNTPSSGLYLKWLDLLYTLRAIKKVPKDTDVIVTNTFFSPIALPSSEKGKILIDVARLPKGQMKYYLKSGRLRANSTPVVEAILKEIPSAYANKVTMIPNPLPFSEFPPIDLEKKEKEILYVGRVHPEKGLELLINAFNKIDFDWQLKIVGPWEVAAGGGGPEYLQSLKQLSKNPNVEFVGPIYGMAALNKFYEQAAIFVYPSIAEKGETFGLAPLEAMAWGVAPIVSDLACFKDFIIDGVNGITFNHRSSDASTVLASIIFELLNDKSKLKSLASNALEVRETHSTAKIAQQFSNEFQSIINEARA